MLFGSLFLIKKFIIFLPTSMFQIRAPAHFFWAFYIFDRKK